MQPYREYFTIWEICWVQSCMDCFALLVFSILNHMKLKWLLVFSQDWKILTTYNHTLSICNDIQSYREYFHYLGALLECFVLLGVFNSGSNETKMVVGVFLRFQINYLQHDYLLSVKSETPMSLL